MTRRVIFALAGAVVLAAAAYAAMTTIGSRSSPIPAGIVSGDGRIEARQVEIAAMHGGRVLAIPVREGDLVAPKAVLARVDTKELETELHRAEAAAALEREVLNEAQAHDAFGLVISALTAALISLIPTLQFSGLLQPVSTLDAGAQAIGRLWPASYFLHLNVGAFTKGSAGPSSCRTSSPSPPSARRSR